MRLRSTRVQLVQALESVVPIALKRRNNQVLFCYNYTLDSWVLVAHDAEYSIELSIEYPVALELVEGNLRDFIVPAYQLKAFVLCCESPDVEITVAGRQALIQCGRSKQKLNLVATKPIFFTNAPADDFVTQVTYTELRDMLAIAAIADGEIDILEKSIWLGFTEEYIKAVALGSGREKVAYAWAKQDNQQSVNCLVSAFAIRHIYDKVWEGDLKIYADAGTKFWIISDKFSICTTQLKGEYPAEFLINGLAEPLSEGAAVNGMKLKRALRACASMAQRQKIVRIHVHIVNNQIILQSAENELGDMLHVIDTEKQWGDMIKFDINSKSVEQALVLIDSVIGEGEGETVNLMLGNWVHINSNSQKVRFALSRMAVAEKL